MSNTGVLLLVLLPKFLKNSVFSVRFSPRNVLYPVQPRPTPLPPALGFLYAGYAAAYKQEFSWITGKHENYMPSLRDSAAGATTLHGQDIYVHVVYADAGCKSR